MSHFDPIRNYLLEHKLIYEETDDEYLEKYQKTPNSLVRIIVEEGLISEEQLLDEELGYFTTLDSNIFLEMHYIRLPDK